MAQEDRPPAVAKKEVRSIFSPQQEEIGKTDVVKETPASVFAKIKKDPVPVRSALVDASDDSTKVAPPPPFKSKKENEGNPFPQEQIDLSRLGSQGVPPVAGIESVVVSTADKPVPVVSKDMQLLVEQLLKEMSVVTTGDKTETTVILRQPPILMELKL